MSEHHQSGLSCLECTSSDAMADYGDHYYCFSCKAVIKKKDGKSFKPKITKAEVEYPPTSIFNPRKFHPDALRWLYGYRIFDDLIEKYKLFYVPFSHRVGLPCLDKDGKLLNYQVRALNPDDDPKYLSRGPKNLFFSSFTKYQYCVIVEDILSAIRVGEQCPAVALNGTALKDQWIWSVVDKYSNIFIWLDGDIPGQQAAKKIVKKLSLYVPCKLLYSDEDPKTYKPSEIREIIGL